MERIFKLYNEDNKDKKTNCKKIPYPENYSKFIEIIKDFAPISDNSKRYKLMEEDFGKREIEDEDDFDLMTKDLINVNIIKIHIYIVDKNMVNNNIENEEAIKYKIPDSLKESFKQKINKLTEEFYEEIEKNFLNKKRK